MSLITSFFVILSWINVSEIYEKSPFQEISITDKCPKEGYNAIGFLESFLTSDKLLPARQATGTTHLTPSQVQILTDPTNTSICEQITNSYPQTTSRKYPGTEEKFHHLVYYKVGEFYFVIIKIRPDSNPDTITAGLEYVDVYDSELNFLKGYSM